LSDSDKKPIAESITVTAEELAKAFIRAEADDFIARVFAYLKGMKNV